MIKIYLSFSFAILCFFNFAIAQGSFNEEIQAETGSKSSGSVDSNNSGYTGSGFVNTDNNNGEWIEIPVNIPSSGSFSIDVTYANGSLSRSMNLLVNGSYVSANDFQSTGGWSTWSTVEFSSVWLNQGDNTIRLVATNASGAPNVDKFNISGNVTVINTAPFIVSNIDNEVIGIEGSTSWNVDLSTIFSDTETPNSLTYSVDIANSSICNFSRIGSDLNINSIALGNSNVIVTATDSENASVSETFNVTVVPNRIKGIAVLLEFPNKARTVGFTRDRIDALYNEIGYTDEFGNNGSIHDYYWEATNHNVYFTCDVADYFMASNNLEFYRDYQEGGKLSWDSLQFLVHQALDAYETTGYDFSGLTRIPGNDNTAGVSVLYPGNAQPNTMWPASGRLDFRAWSNEANNMTIGFNHLAQIGENALKLTTICHELGHMLLEFPDLYDQGDPNMTDLDANGIGRYGAMGSNQNAFNPLPFNPHFRINEGWESPTEINLSSNDQAISIPANSYNTYKFTNPANPAEYFLIESVRNEGRWTDFGNDGLVIWHIDENASPTQSPNLYPNMTQALHYGISVIQADGDYDLENDVNNGDINDIFIPGTTFTNSSPANSLWWDGTASGLNISNIILNGNLTQFTVDGSGVVEQLSYEMEDGSYSNGSVDNNNQNYSGSGFVNTDNAVGEWAEIPVNVANAGQYNLVLTFANGGSSSRGMNILVNGTNVGSLQGSSTGNWTTWLSESITLNLNSGTNTIRFVATTTGGDPNLDKIDLAQIGSSPAMKSDFLASEANVEENVTIYPNPVVTSALISFNLVEDSKVTITMSDVLGKSLFVLADGTFEAGNNTIELNADDVESGVYNLTVQTVKSIFVKQVLIK